MQACSFLFVERKGSDDVSQTSKTVKGHATQLIHQRAEDPRCAPAVLTAACFHVAEKFTENCSLDSMSLYLVRCEGVHTSRQIFIYFHRLQVGVLRMQGSHCSRYPRKARRSARSACSHSRRAPLLGGAQCSLSCCTTDPGDRSRINPAGTARSVMSMRMPTPMGVM